MSKKQQKVINVNQLSEILTTYFNLSDVVIKKVKCASLRNQTTPIIQEIGGAGVLTIYFEGQEKEVEKGTSNKDKKDFLFTRYRVIPSLQLILKSKDGEWVKYEEIQEWIREMREKYKERQERILWEGDEVK